jgi:hypothetical protein
MPVPAHPTGGPVDRDDHLGDQQPEQLLALAGGGGLGVENRAQIRVRT